jgi:hypothetical protein
MHRGIGLDGFRRAELDALAFQLLHEGRRFGNAIVAEIKLERRRRSRLRLEAVALPMRVLDELRGSCDESRK